MFAELLFIIGLLDQRDVNQQISATCWHLIQVTRNEEPLCTAVQTPRRLFKSSALYIAFALCRNFHRTTSYFQSSEQLYEGINLFLILDFAWISLSMLMHCRAVDTCFHMFSIIIMLLSEHYLSLCFNLKNNQKCNTASCKKKEKKEVMQVYLKFKQLVENSLLLRRNLWMI